MSSDESGERKMLGGLVTIRPGAPIELTELGQINSCAPEHFNKAAQQIGATLKSYLVAARSLLDGRYSALRDLAPAHMTGACYPKVFLFPEGILLRYDLEQNPEFEVFVGMLRDGSLADWTPSISESFLHCAAHPTEYEPGDRTITLTLSAKSADGEEREISKQRIYAIAPPPSSGASEAQIAVKRPMPSVSIRNEFDFMMEIQVPSEDGQPQRRFLTRNRFRLPVGWEAIELYPPYADGVWDPNLAAMWAENDLLAAVLQRNMRENQFHAIDPNAHTRKRMIKLFTDFERLLVGDEEPLHQFIKMNPELLSPTHNRMWSKLSLGKRDTDFVFREPSGEYILVELEKPSHLLFRKDGQQRAGLTHAIDQVLDWRRYIEDNLGTVQREVGLEGISSNPQCLVVIGRSSSLDGEGKRKLVALENAMPRLRIMTYDDVLANARATVENILSPLWNPGSETQVYLLR